MKKKILENLLGIDYPIIQGGMVWVSGAKLASAVSEAGCLGTIGAGSMKPALLQEHIVKAKKATSRSLAVNVPILYSGAQDQVQCALDQGIKIFITSAGSPKKFTKLLKDNNCLVGHVVSNPLLAKKCEDAGVDFIIAEGFEAGGHNGRNELTTMTLIPQVVDAVSLPVVAAGGIADARGLLASRALGAVGVQMGTRFLMSKESSAHDNFKKLLVKTSFNSTRLLMKKHVPVRLLLNEFAREVQALEASGASREKLVELLGRGRAKDGILGGDIINGELEVGQTCSSIQNIDDVQTIVSCIIDDYQLLVRKLKYQSVY